MGIFDDEFNNEDFLNRWERFNNRMMNDEEFRKEMEKTQKDFQELMKMLLTRRNFDSPLDFRIIPLNNSYKISDYKIPEDELNIENGRDEEGEWETKNWTSPDGSISFSSFSRSSSFEDYTDKFNRFRGKRRDKTTIKSEKYDKLKLEKLQKALDYAVENEKYEKAAEIKKMIDEIKSEK
jgi:hypothetical protein